MSRNVEFCPLTKLSGGLSRLHSADEDAVTWLSNCSYSRMCVMNHNWSARKQRLHLQSAAGINLMALCKRLDNDAFRCWQSINVQLHNAHSPGRHCRRGSSWLCDQQSSIGIQYEGEIFGVPRLQAYKKKKYQHPAGKNQNWWSADNQRVTIDDTTDPWLPPVLSREWVTTNCIYSLTKCIWLCKIIQSWTKSHLVPCEAELHSDKPDR